MDAELLERSARVGADVRAHEVAVFRAAKTLPKSQKKRSPEDIWPPAELKIPGVEREATPLTCQMRVTQHLAGYSNLVWRLT